MSDPPKPPAKRPLGVIDTLSAGLSVVAHHPWLLLLPIVVDLLLWLAPPLTLGPELVAGASAPLDPQGPNGALLTAEVATDLPALYESVQAQLRGANLWAAAVPPLLFWPSVAASAPDALVRVPSAARALHGWTTVAATWLALSLAGLFVNVLWLHGVARSVRGKRWLAEPEVLLRRTGRDGLRLLGIGLLIVLGLIALLLPVSFGVALVALLLPSLGSLLSTMVAVGSLWFTLWLALHLYFTVAAVVLMGQGVVRAPWASQAVVRQFFRSSIGLIGVSVVLTWGFQVIWSGLSGTAWGTVTSIVANAALGTALTAAMMIFFAQRLPLLERIHGRDEAARA